MRLKKGKSTYRIPANHIPVDIVVKVSGVKHALQEVPPDSLRLKLIKKFTGIPMTYSFSSFYKEITIYPRPEKGWELSVICEKRERVLL